MILTIEQAKQALDMVLGKGRSHMYKPIQVAEILYRDRVKGDINLRRLETYRVRSREWRDDISIPLVGRKCNSTMRFQDNLFEQNALPPSVLFVLGQENRRTGGAVEAYIYSRIIKKYAQLRHALEYCEQSTTASFSVTHLIDSLWAEPGLRRSIDKVYEIVVYALFATLVDSLGIEVAVTVKEEALPLLHEFEDFSEKVMCLNVKTPHYIQDAKVYRMGVTNAADRGLDMYSNWGPAIQVKHLSLDAALAQDIVEGVSCDHIIIVCKEVEKETIVSLLSQIGWRKRIQSVVTESDLVDWYEKALRGRYAKMVGEPLLETLVEEISEEFPSTSSLPAELLERGYDTITDVFWKAES